MVIAVFYILLFLLYTIFSRKIKRTRNMDMIVFVLYALALAILAYNMKLNGDLLRHQQFMNSIRNSGVTYFELIKTPLYTWEHNRFYLVFNLLCYISAYIGNANILSAFMVLCDYLIFAYISVDWCWSKRININYFYPLILSIMFMPFIHAFSGMRNATAAALMGLAIYLYFVKRKRWEVPIVLVVIGVLIHPAILMAIPFVVLSGKKLTWKKMAVVFGGVVSLQLIANLMVISPISFLRFLGRMYLQYSSSSQYVSSRRYLYADLICIILFVLLLIIKWKKQEDFGQLESFFVLYMLFVLGNIGNYDLVLRPSYIFGVMAVPLVSTIYGRKVTSVNKKSLLKILSKIITSACAIWVIADCIYVYIFDYFYI